MSSRFAFRLKDSTLGDMDWRLSEPLCSDLVKRDARRRRELLLLQAARNRLFLHLSNFALSQEDDVVGDILDKHLRAASDEVEKLAKKQMN